MGATLAAMFPDRIDKVVLDGNMNVHQYWNGWESEMFAATDATFRGFLAGCVAAGPELCPFEKDKTPEQLEEEIVGLLDDLDRLSELLSGLGFHFKTDLRRVSRHVCGDSRVEYWHVPLLVELSAI